MDNTGFDSLMQWLQFLNIIKSSDGTVSYLTVSTDDILNTTNNETAFTEIRRVFEEYFLFILSIHCLSFSSCIHISL